MYIMRVFGMCSDHARPRCRRKMIADQNLLRLQFGYFISF